MTDRIILIDDEPEFTEELSFFLEPYGIDCMSLSEPTALVPMIKTEKPDLIVLDQRLGKTTGVEVLREVRAVSGVPCIILTAMENPIDRIVGLELGADDYIQKTASPREILARIRAVLRRSRGAASDAASSSGWDFRPDERELYQPDGTRCGLTSAEFVLLQMLIDARGEPVNREVLTETIFNRPYRAGDRAVDGLIVRLRRIVEPDQANAVVIKSARQQGYIFTGFASSPSR
jgi:DNA-binding response OmpR family regulator